MMRAKVQTSLQRVSRWVEEHNYRGYDPGDGQLSFLRAFTFKQPFLERVLTGAILRVPFNVRPLLGIRPHTSSKGMGYMAWGYVRLYTLSHQRRYAERAAECLNWLMRHRAPKYGEYCWGNEFSFSTRAGKIPRQEPTLVWSSLIGQAFLDAYEAFGDERYLEAAASTCDWVLRVPRETTQTGLCLSYVAYDQLSIHNSNMLGAALLARVGRLTGNCEAMETARNAMRYSCSRQHSDGAWFYGESPKYHWIDAFHTGYNLDSLKRYIDNTGDTGFAGPLKRGYSYFKKNFFEASGAPKYYHDKTYPIDIQCAAQSIDTLTYFSDSDQTALGLAWQVADWTIDHMQAADGHFYYRDLGWKRVKTPMLHWGQGTMFKALAHLLSTLELSARAGDSRPRLTVAAT
jgi:hypothetical protein